ncbi:MAG: CinA family protein [Chloroflexi bacterium]|nr:CinA family protein [Chloroflexota bacterium]MBI5702726.1 CinA family protein [Chloroflexota bacterium]
MLEVEIGKLLSARRLRLGLAESCTGGLVGHRITNVAGSSDYFMGGVVSYSYEAKVAVLGVSWDTLHTFGAVSRKTVLEMARGARKLFDADIAVSISGIAGPGGGTAEKPVGTTWIALVADGGEWTRKFQFQGSREENKAASAEAALQMLLDYLLGKFTP